jgi:hypothetical protein
MRCAIGQARIDDVTPLQVAVALGALGHGTLRPPQLVQSIEGYGDVPARTAVDLGCTPDELEVIRSALDAVVDSGTAAGLLGELSSSAQRHAAERGTPRLEPGKLARLVGARPARRRWPGARAGGWLAQRYPTWPPSRATDAARPPWSRATCRATTTPGLAVLLEPPGGTAARVRAGAGRPAHEPAVQRLPARGWRLERARPLRAWRERAGRLPLAARAARRVETTHAASRRCGGSWLFLAVGRWARSSVRRRGRTRRPAGSSTG